MRILVVLAELGAGEDYVSAYCSFKNNSSLIMNSEGQNQFHFTVWKRQVQSL